MSNFNASTSRFPAKQRVCVLGAGVIGLSTAVRIQEKSNDWGDIPQVEVTVVADRFSPHTTSDGSGGFWEPYNLGSTPMVSVRQWSYATWDHLHSLATSADLAATLGAQFVSGFTLSDSQTIQDAFFKDKVLGYRHLTQQELRSLFPFARSGYFHTSLQINVQSYLPWLMQRFKDAGGKTEFRAVQNLSQVADGFDVVVNCCGVRAGALSSDTETVPIRGQIRRTSKTATQCLLWDYSDRHVNRIPWAEMPWVKHFYVFDAIEGHISYILPLGEVVVVGGLAQKGNWKEELDAADSENIWNRAVSCFPFIKNGRMISEWAGLRPGRTTVRLEAETLTMKGKSLPVVHNYGHGGAGVTLHWGCAGQTADLVHAALRDAATPSRL